MAFAFVHSYPFEREGRFGGRMSFGNEATHEFEVVDTPEAYIIYFDASEFKRDGLKISISEGRLSIRAIKSTEGSEATIERSWNLPKNIVQDGVNAKLDDNNELTVVLPKAPEERKVEFQVPVEGVTPESNTEQPPAAEEPGPSNVDHQGGAEGAMDVDGSWVDVADEDVAKAKAKGKAPEGGSVVQAAEEQAGPSNA